MASPTHDARRPQRLQRTRRGAAAEVLAARHLRAQGLTVLARNVRCRGGEIDLLCRDGELLVVVEVRMRSGRDFGGALASVGPHKRRALLRATRYLLLRTPALRSLRLRFDVVGIERSATGALSLSWIRDAFRAG
jgi:putative endonuclease